MSHPAFYSFVYILDQIQILASCTGHAARPGKYFIIFDIQNNPRNTHFTLPFSILYQGNENLRNFK